MEKSEEIEPAFGTFNMAYDIKVVVKFEGNVEEAVEEANAAAAEALTEVMEHTMACNKNQKGEEQCLRQKAWDKTNTSTRMGISGVTEPASGTFILSLTTKVEAEVEDCGQEAAEVGTIAIAEAIEKVVLGLKDQN